jgi:hypothetical protein
MFGSHSVGAQNTVVSAKVVSVPLFMFVVTARHCGDE